MSVVLGCLASVFIPETDFLDPSDMPLFVCSDASELLFQIVMPGVETLLQRDEFPYYKTRTSHVDEAFKLGSSLTLFFRSGFSSLKSHH